MSRIIHSSADLAQNPAYELVKEEYLDSLKCPGIVLRHRKSGARIFLFPNGDENKLFCAAFRTPPSDSTGVAHIIEHTVLCGSKNYPSRDPFMLLAKGSLHTFLNAVTFPDKTLYPVSSVNDRDFRNLMGVYLDAVFYPNIGRIRQIFMQEGWHYELEEEGDPLTLNGVVYSEMKGAMSSPERRIWEDAAQALFPDTAYGFNSGGDPTVIPSLTYEDYLEFYRTHYHPSNAYLFLYGNADPDERLAFLDEAYLSAFDAIRTDTAVGRQPRWHERKLRRVTSRYSVNAGEETEGKAYLACAAVGADALDPIECRAWDVLSEVLLNMEGAPVREALNEAGIGEDIYGGNDNGMIDEMLIVVAKNAKAEDADRFVSVVREAFRRAAEEGINEKALLATINRAEFRFREADYGGDPRGLEVAVNALGSWLYDEDAPFAYLHTLDEFEELRRRIGTGWYEGLIRKRILECEHGILLTLLPEEGLIEREEAALAGKLAERKQSMSPEEIARLVRETKELRDYQERPETEEERSCIPVLRRTDIPEEGRPLSNEEISLANTPAVLHRIETNGIVYADLIFDLPRLPKKMVPYLGLLARLLGRVGTARRTYGELDVDIRLNTGSLDFTSVTVRLYGTEDDYRPTFAVSARMMPDKVGWTFDTAREIALTTDFADHRRIRILLAEIKSELQMQIMSRGDAVAAARARSYYSKTDCYQQSLAGLDFYFFLTDLLEHFDERAEEMTEMLRLTAAAVFDPSRLTVGLAADPEGIRAAEASLPAFCRGLGTGHPVFETEEFAPVIRNEGIIIPSQVQYVARAGNMRRAGLSYTGVCQVARTAVNTDWLYQEIRVKGGAYGCGVSFNGPAGDVVFTSYRDPKLRETDEVFRGTGEFIRNAGLEEEELNRLVIGTFSAYERPYSPAGLASRSMSAWLTGQTYEDLVRFRREMLHVTPEELRRTADVFDSVPLSGCFCTVGGESAIRANEELFGTLVRI